MSFAATWMDLEFVILSKVIQTEKDKISFEIACMWNIKKMVQMGGEQGQGRDKLGDWDLHIHNTIYKVDN